jgi:hypothetical protein
VLASFASCSKHAANVASAAGFNSTCTLAYVIIRITHLGKYHEQNILEKNVMVVVLMKNGTTVN